MGKEEGMLHSTHLRYVPSDAVCNSYANITYGWMELEAALVKAFTSIFKKKSNNDF